MTENEMVGWHHRCDGHEFKQAPAVGDGEVRIMKGNQSAFVSFDSQVQIDRLKTWCFFF